jgi:hypothetical protein
MGKTTLIEHSLRNTQYALNISYFVFRINSILHASRLHNKALAQLGLMSQDIQYLH